MLDRICGHFGGWPVPPIISHFIKLRGSLRDSRWCARYSPVGRVHAAPKMALHKQRPALRILPTPTPRPAQGLRWTEKPSGNHPPFGNSPNSDNALFGTTDRAIECGSPLAFGLPEAPTFRYSAYESGDRPLSPALPRATFEQLPPCACQRAEGSYGAPTCGERCTRLKPSMPIDWARIAAAQCS